MTKIVAVLMTCHDRRNITLRCLSTLKAQHLPDAWRIAIYLVDDGSSDGTSDAVKAAHPDVVVIPGTGDLYWTGGMSVADQAAITHRPDLLLWLNDDVELADGAIAMLLDSALETRQMAIVVGTAVDPDSKMATYGGYVRLDRPLNLELVQPNGQLRRVDTMNGNVVLVPLAVRDRVGPLDMRFQHNMSDMDYGFRARKAGVEVVVSPRVVGTCGKNPEKSTWSDPTVPLGQRLRAVVSVKGLPPRQWLRFTVRHTGWWWPRYFIGPYLRAAFTVWSKR
jgi:GT2 family glycosyltransferase